MAEVLPAWTTAGWLATPESHEYLVVDVFTVRPLEGNQLGVFLDGRSFGSAEMLRLAREMNFAETVFLLAPAAAGDAAMRIFTPGGELPFAGHPVLGTAFVVAAASGKDRVVLETGAGPIPVVLERDEGRVVSGRMWQPIPSWEPFDRPSELLGALGIEASALPIELYRNGPGHVYVALRDEQAVAGLRPDMSLLSDLGVAANCFAGQDQRWKTRMFFPAGGVPEDAATGSAAGPLAAHLARHGQIAFGQEIEIRQGEEINRPSDPPRRGDQPPIRSAKARRSTAHRCSTRERQEPRTGSTRLRSPGVPRSWRTDTFACAEAGLAGALRLASGPGFDQVALAPAWPPAAQFHDPFQI